jgi:hypothetical protein
VNFDWSVIDPYLPAIQALPFRNPLTQRDILTPDFQVFRDDQMEIYFAPFLCLKPEARVVIIGITPGWQQMELAIRTFREGLELDWPREKIAMEIENRASFAGPMRTNLVRMLNNLDIPRYLSIASADALFADADYLVHTTSAIRYPVFVEGKNYTGHRPKILDHAKLLWFAEYHLLPELTAVSKAIIIPLGKAVSDLLRYLISLKKLHAGQCLLDFPHPSGANGHRARQFAERRVRFLKAVDQWFSQPSS